MRCEMNNKQKDLIEKRIRTLKNEKRWNSFMCFGFVIAGLLTLAVLIGFVFLILAGVKGKRIREANQEITRLEIELLGD